MATYTSNLNLKKPNAEDFYNVADFNGNADILDTEVAGKANKVVNGTAGNFVKLDANGDISDSGTSADDMTNHIATNVTSENGVHGIRYNDNKLQYYDNSTWNDAKTATHLYLSKWKIIYSDDNYNYYTAGFAMFTSYEPTATNLSTFKQMVGTNVGALTNIIPLYLPPNTYEYYLQSVSISNGIFSAVVSNSTSNINVYETRTTLTKSSTYQIF